MSAECAHGTIDYCLYCEVARLEAQAAQMQANARSAEQVHRLGEARVAAAELARDTAYDTAAVLYSLISRSSSRALKGAARRLFGRFIDMPSGRELREARHQRIAAERAEKRNQWRALVEQRDALQRRITEAVGALTGKAGYVEPVVHVRPHVFVIGEVDAERLREQVARRDAEEPVDCFEHASNCCKDWCRHCQAAERSRLGVVESHR